MKAIWKGSLSFGLVNIPVELHSASRNQELKFVMLHDKDHSTIRYARICKEEEKEVPWNEIVKGYDTGDGKYVIMSDEDFKKAMPEKSSTIDIIQFSDEDQIDTILFEKPYVLDPQKGAEKAYQLLIEALKKSKKVGIAKFVLHNREHLAVIKNYGNFILLIQLRYTSEILSFKELKHAEAQKTSSKEVSIALQLIENMTAPFDPKKFKDTYIDELKDIIKRKEKGKSIAARPTAKAPSKKVHDIMSLLKASLEESEKKPKRKTRTRGAA